MTDSSCSTAEFTRLVKPLAGLVVSRPWIGAGSAIFLELGDLTPLEWRGQLYPKGEACISVEWDWRVEDGVSVLYGSSNSRPRISRGIASLQGTRAQSLSVVGEVPELFVVFSNGQCLRSMVMVTGDPEWSVRLLDGRYVYPKSGTLLLGEGGGYSMTEQEKQAFAVAEQTAARWGKPVAEPVAGKCGQCEWFVPIDGEGHLLDYGVCLSKSSPFDGRAVNRAGGCPAFVRRIVEL
jgi:hypothetical protein